MERHLRRIVIPTLLLGTSLYSYSEKVTLSDARSLAAEFVSARTGNPVAGVSLETVFTAGSEKAPIYYVFNLADNSGFVMVSAENTTTPILGYSFQNGFPAMAMPDGMKWMLAGLEKEIKAAPSLQSSKNASDLKKSARKSAEKAGKKELSTPKWSQEGPFNAMIPGRPLVGCVGTAMATIMKYYEYPQAGSGSFGGVDFGTTYDWSNMRMDNYRSGYSATEGDAVALLMYHASKSIDTQYAMSGSSAYEVRVPGALSAYFGYDPGVSYKKRQEVATQAEWDAIIRNEIDANRPVLYCGQDVTAGHAFVCDGYEGEYFHFNWGWGGSADGYFTTTALNPTVSRTHHYNNLNTIIYNIKPFSGTIAEWSPIHITADGNQAGIGSDLTDLSSGQKFKVRVGNLKNITNDNFSGKIAVALCSENGAMKALLSKEQNLTMQSMGYLFNGYTEFSDCSLPSGVAVSSGDRVRIMTKADGQNVWLPVAGELLTINELDPNSSASASFSVTLPSVAGVTVEGESRVIRGWDYTFKVSPANAAEDVVTVKANGITLTASGDTYRILNVRENQEITILVQKAADVKEKRSIWVGTPGTLSEIISDSETGTIKDLTLFGTIDARDFKFMRDAMNLRRLDISGVTITANGSDQANAIPREAFLKKSSLQEVILPKSVNRFNNGCFRQCGITSISIPTNVSKYEYNIFVGCSALRDIYVGRGKAEFINWCVLSGVKVDLVTLHVPNEAAVSNYRNAENWGTIKNIIVDQPATTNDVLFAVMDNSEVKFETSILPGMKEKGEKVSFKATHIADNDNLMEVYANSTKLASDAEGNYNVTLSDNTIIHFDLTAPTSIDANKSPWTLTDKNGSIGMFTDAVNVIPGSDFTVRLNALNIPRGYDQMYWAMALTDSKGNIKEFISPVTVWNAGAADNFRLNVNCKVQESTVREGNRLRLVTSYNKKSWNLVGGSSDAIVADLPALNNMTPVYNINVPSVENATVSGVTSTAVRGRDLTLKVTPTSAAYRVDVSVNGKQVVRGAANVNYGFVAMEDMDFDINVYDPKAERSVTFEDVPLGGLYKAMTAETVAAHVIIKGDVYSNDLGLALRQDFAARTIKKLDLSGARIVADVLTPTSEFDRIPNYIPANLLYNSTAINTVMPVVEEILLPKEVTRIEIGAFRMCSKIKEITLPTSLSAEKNIKIGEYASGQPKYGYSLGYGLFEGCTSLKTIYLPCAPSKVNGKDVVSFFDPYGTYNTDMLTGITKMYDLGFWIDGKPDASDITLVVPEEYINVYKTPYSDMTSGNPWVACKYNILPAKPVYGVEFNPSQVKAEEGTDVTAIASFLGENVKLESLNVEKKLRLANPGNGCKVYDNGEEITPDSEGYINLTFYNPAKNATKAGNHKIDVIYTYQVAFNSTSPLFEISTPEVANENEYDFHSFDNSDALAPVLKNVAENSAVRFKVNFSDENEGLEARVMNGQEELIPDGEGFYTLNITNSGKNIDIFAVPGNGATLTADELAAIKPEEAHSVTAIALTGEMTADDFATAVDCFQNLETLDLSGLTCELPESAFSGMENLTTVVLPEIEEVSANMFNGCGNLQSIDIPASVSSIGEGAFKDCVSLEKLTLTGVSNIGEGAFEGCDNLTTITLLASGSDSKSETRRRSARKASRMNSGSFQGLNPNCIILLDEGVEMPDAEANYLRTRTGIITETGLDGTQEEREGRVYAASSDINFVQGYPLAIPYAFTVEEGAVVSMETETHHWTPVVVPFDVQTITDAANQELAIMLADEDAEYVEENAIYTLSADNEKLHSVEKIEANTPCFIYTKESGATIFATGEGTVPATPEEIRIDGKNFSIHASYKAQTLPADGIYLLDSASYAFSPAEGEGEEGEEPTVTVNPFELYATSSLRPSEILTELPGLEKPLETGVANEVETDGLKIVKEGGKMVIYSSESRIETIYSADGKAAFTVALNAGRNELNLQAAGIYVIAGVKVIF